MNGNGDNGRNGLARVAIRCQSDSRLVKLVREGHDLAFDEVVRRYRPQLVAYAAAIVPDHHAEDVVQEALTRAHTALGRSDGEMRLRPWLYTVVRNGALNALRDEPVHTHLDENYDGVPQPPEVAARREELAELTASVKDLPDQQREALVKRELEGRSHEEIGVSLGVSAGAVRGLIYRARATLRDGAGMVIPLPVLRALLSSSQAMPETTGAAGAAAAGLAGGGGGIALKAGATLGVAVIAVGSGIAVQHRDSGSAKDPATGAAPVHSARADGTGGSGGGVRLADAARPGGRASGQEGEGSPSSGPGGGRDGSSGSSSGPGSGGHSGGGGSSGPGPGTGGRTDHGGHSGSGSGGDDGTGISSGPGGGGRGDDGGGSTTNGHDGSGSSGSGGSDDGTSGSGGGGEISGHDGGSSGSGSSGSSGDGGGTSGGSSGDDGSSGSGSGSSGSGSGGSGSGGDGGSTATATTTTDGGGGGTSGGSD
jgi:RNA polymerase sigma factor (sigma-70 family)